MISWNTLYVPSEENSVICECAKPIGLNLTKNEFKINNLCVSKCTPHLQAQYIDTRNVGICANTNTESIQTSFSIVVKL